MEPITLCGVVIVAFGLWVEFEAVIMRWARAVCGSSLVTALLSSVQEPRAVVTITPGGYRGYRTGSSLSYRVARS